jgi:hypothetical protein
MKKNSIQPDRITVHTCRWLMNGCISGGYDGPDPGTTHDLSPLLSGETANRELYLKSTASWFRREQIINPVLEKLEAEGCRIWAFKGFDLARSVYPFPGGRQMCDADFMVEESHLRHVISAFRTEGWEIRTPGDGVFNSGIVSELKMHRMDSSAEIHTHVFYFPATFPGRLPSDLYSEGRLLEPGLMGFAWHNTLLMCLLHMLTHIDLRPAWWVDVCLLCAKVTETGSWKVFTENAWGTCLGKPLASLLSTAAVNLDAPVPQEVTSVLESDDRGREGIIEKLNARSKVPTLLNLIHLTGWKRISWLFSILWLALTGQHPLRRG